MNCQKRIAPSLSNDVLSSQNMIVQTFDIAVDYVVRDFLLAEDGFRNERELHWSLFHYLPVKAHYVEAILGFIDEMKGE